MLKTLAFNKDNYKCNRPIIVYGASVYGELAYVALESLGIKLDYFCDKSEKREKYFGIEVITPRNLDILRSSNIIIASADFFYEIKSMLIDIGCENIFDMSYLLKMELPLEKLSNRAKEVYSNREYYLNVVKSQSQDSVIFNRIQYVVTEKCSLKCKDCSHLIQYYKQPEDIDVDYYKSAFDLLLENVDSITELRILGGEPFVTKETKKLINLYGKNSKIQDISIYTNGTIIPDREFLNLIEENDVKLHISNYKININKINKLVEELEKYNIKYFVREYDEWQDAGGVEYRNYTLEHTKKIFATCFERNGYSFLKGKLYRCPRSAHGINLKAMPDTHSNYVDLFNWCDTENKLREKLIELQNLSWLEACKYCSGPDNHTIGIPAAIQIREPIEYKKIY